jgi:peptidoglycan/LPS O-acetylase OafA/YrhL
MGLVGASYIWRLFLLDRGRDLDRIYNSFDTRVGSLLIGAALAIFLATPFGLRFLSWLKQHGTAYSVAIAVSLMTLVVGVIVTHWTMPISHTLMMPLAEGAIVVLLCGLFIVPTHSVYRFLKWQPVRWIGQISYGLYLWHFPIFQYMFRYDVTPLTVLVVGSAITFVAATASYYLLELPLARYRGRLHPQQAAAEAPHVIAPERLS